MVSKSKCLEDPDAFPNSRGDRLIDLSGRNRANESMATKDVQIVRQAVVASKAGHEQNSI